jgi:predicted TPR repeat methyltransferase
VRDRDVFIKVLSEHAVFLFSWEVLDTSGYWRINLNIRYAHDIYEPLSVNRFLSMEIQRIEEYSTVG